MRGRLIGRENLTKWSEPAQSRFDYGHIQKRASLSLKEGHVLSQIVQGHPITLDPIIIIDPICAMVQSDYIIGYLKAIE